jgi:hypothetical protein
VTLEITLDEATEEITIVLDNHLVLSAYKDASSKLVYSKNFSKITEDDVYRNTKQICQLLLLNTST